jgi:hypothetical protein
MINRKERVSDVADDYSCEYLNALEKLKQRKIIGRKAKKTTTTTKQRPNFNLAVCIRRVVFLCYATNFRY